MPPMPACPACGSTASRFLTAVYEDGTFEYADGYMRQTLSAQRAAPPRKRSLLLPLLGVALVPAWGVWHRPDATLVMLAFGGLGALGMLGWLGLTLHHNFRTHRREVYLWQHTLRCARCGHLYSDRPEVA